MKNMTNFLIYKGFIWVLKFMVSKDARIFNFFKKWIYVGKKCLGSRLAYLFKKEYAK